jgi:hypothetical protein
MRGIILCTITCRGLGFSLCWAGVIEEKVGELPEHFGYIMFGDKAACKFKKAAARIRRPVDF